MTSSADAPAEKEPPNPRVLILSCSPHAGGTTDVVARVLERTLSAHGGLAETIRLRNHDVRPCIGCGFCSDHPGTCVFDDEAAQLFQRLDAAHTLIVAAPVYFYGPPAALKGFIDRAQSRWALRESGRVPAGPRRPARAVLCAARTKGERLFEASLLILRCFLDTLGFDMRDPLLLRGAERPADILHPPALARIEAIGCEAAGEGLRLRHE